EAPPRALGDVALAFGAARLPGRRALRRDRVRVLFLDHAVALLPDRVRRLPLALGAVRRRAPPFREREGRPRVRSPDGSLRALGALRARRERRLGGGPSAHVASCPRADRDAPGRAPADR